MQNKLQLEFEHWYLNFTAMIIGIIQFKYCKKKHPANDRQAKPEHELRKLKITASYREVTPPPPLFYHKLFDNLISEAVKCHMMRQISAPAVRGRNKIWKLDTGVSSGENLWKKLSFASNAKKRIVILTFQNIINWKRSIDLWHDRDFGLRDATSAPLECVT